MNFYVYDQDGNPIPDVLISACGKDSFYKLEKTTDANGRFYYPRRVNSFELFTATRDGYWCIPQEKWLKQYVNSGLPPMLRAEFRDHAINIPTTNSLHSLNVFMKKIPRTLPVADSYHLVVSNVVPSVEYGIDLSTAELCAPFGAGKYADSPACIYLNYWNVDVSVEGALVCDYLSRREKKVIVPSTEKR